MATTTSESAADEQEQQDRSGSVAVLDRVRRQLQQLLAFGSLLVIFIFFSIIADYFFTYGNVINILFATVVVGTLALGTTFVIITGGIDLSVGTGMALTAVMSGVFITNMGLPVIVGVVGAILVGGLIGFVNGFNVAILGLPPFIATLAMLQVCAGLALVISDSAPIYFDEDPSYILISSGELIPGLSNAVLILLVVAALLTVVLNKTLLGRYAFAIGSNEEATALSGINVKKWKILIYTFAGLFIGVAGVLISARLNSAQPGTGLGYELQAIAAVVIGGTSLSGGRGTIVGTLIGALIISVINNGLQLMSVPQEWQNVILGAVILVAVYTDIVRKRRTT